MMRPLIVLTLTGLMAACASAKKETDKAMSAPAPQTVTAAHEAGSANVTEVNFDRGSFVLSEGARSALTDMIGKARSAGDVRAISVLAWADSAYPSDAKKTLSPADRDLAKRRADAISNYLKTENLASNVDVYNMAERPNAVERLFNTSDARVKNAFEEAGVTSSEGKTITGKASRAVIMAMPNR